jgi:uncharacterized protein (TIGR02646 family)
MRNITKQPEPASLTAWRQTNPTDYNGYAYKDGLRDSLVYEQRGICCYCQCRIYSSYDTMKIEHWASHRHYPQQRLVYRNLLGACLGGKGKPGTNQYCDSFKGEQELCRNPADPAHDVETVMHFKNDGSVTSTNAQLNEELNSVLNLNDDFLKNNRIGALESFKVLYLKRDANFTRNDWQRLLDDWSGANHNGELRPYCGVVIYWLKKRIARLP